MNKKGLTLKFTLEELRDNITQYKCGVRGQCRRFYQLDKELMWNGKTTQLKVPVVHLKTFPDHVQHELISSKLLYFKSRLDAGLKLYYNHICTPIIYIYIYHMKVMMQ